MINSSKVESFWLLPDRQQIGTIFTIKNGDKIDISQVISLKDLPLCFVLGIPEELLRGKITENFIYAQFVRLNSFSIFACSIVVGRDVSGRRVFLTNIKKVDKNYEDLRGLLSFEDSELVQLDGDIIRGVSILKNTISTQKNILKMLDAIKCNKQYKTYSSEELKSAVYLPDWMPLKYPKIHNLKSIVKKKRAVYFLIVSIIIYIILTYFIK